MSVSVRAWVSKQKIKPAAAKFVLFAMADCSNEFGRSFPSISYIEQFTCLDPKTISGHWKTLQELGFIEDTGERVGATKQVIVWRIKEPNPGSSKAPQKRDASDLEAPQTIETKGGNEGTETEAPQKRDASSETPPLLESKPPVFGPEPPRFSGESPPKTGDVSVLNHTEPSLNPGPHSQPWRELGFSGGKKPRAETPDPTIAETSPKAISKAELDRQRDRFQEFANRYVYPSVTFNQWRRQHFVGNPPIELVFPADEENPDERPMRRVTLADLAMAAH